MIKFIPPFFLFSVLTLLLTCQQNQELNPAHTLTVVHAIGLYQEPKEDSKVLKQLEPGTLVEEQGVVSPYLVDIYLEDSLYHEPWIQVRDQNQSEGWVFIGALKKETKKGVTDTEWRWKKRFEACFGLTLTKRFNSWEEQLSSLDTDSSLAHVVRESLYLRDTLNQLMAQFVLPATSRQALSFFWLTERMPTFIVQKTNSGQHHQLFLDLRYLNQLAQNTSGEQDDHFVNAWILAFPKDSIESALPSWSFPISTEYSYSNLGTGAHLASLTAISSAWQSGDLFRPELQLLKDRLLEDILSKDREYWQSQEKILSELERIINTPLACISDRDKLALQARLLMFKEPDKHSLKLNLRTGN